MSRKGRHDTGGGSSREQKRQQFQAPAQRASRGWIVVIVAGVGVTVALVAAFALRGGGSDTGDSAAPVAAAAAAAAAVVPVSASPEGQVRLALAELGDGRAKFYDFNGAGGTPIRFFAIRDTDGTYRAALDACEICYRAKKGYYQSGNELVCRQCGNSYAPRLIDESPGGCHPVALPRVVDGEYLVVQAADIERVESQLASQPPTQRRMPAGRFR